MPAIAWQTSQTPFHRGPANLCQLLQQRLGHTQFPVPSQMLSQCRQVWCQPLGTGIVQALRNHLYRSIHLWPVGGATFPPSALPLQNALVEEGVEVYTDSTVTGVYEDNWCAINVRSDPNFTERLIKARQSAGARTQPDRGRVRRLPDVPGRLPAAG